MPLVENFINKPPFEFKERECTARTFGYLDAYLNLSASPNIIKMPNKNYQNGAAKERRIMNKFRDDGLISFRSAGSHSPIDVVAIDKKSHIIYLIQSKPASMSEQAKLKIAQDNIELNALFEVKFKVI